jgi:hypothetical protein
LRRCGHCPKPFGPNGSDVSGLSFGNSSDGLVLTSSGAVYRFRDGGHHLGPRAHA